MMGIDVDRVIVVTFLIGSALAGAAGVMTGLVFERVCHRGFLAGLKGFAAAVVGGIGSIRRHGRRPCHRARRVLLHRVRLVDVLDLVVFAILIAVMLVADRPARQGGDQELMSELEPEQPRIGVDGVGCDRGSRRRRGRGLVARTECFRSRPGSSAIRRLVLFAALIPFVTLDDYILRVSIDTLIYALLALGLDVVVGWAGLLDLGYVAFFGIGAYSYVLLSLDEYGIHLERSSRCR